MATRQQQILDAAVDLLGEQGVRAVTHRAVDAAAGLPAGATSNLFRTREALFDGIVDRIAHSPGVSPSARRASARSRRSR